MANKEIFEIIDLKSTGKGAFQIEVELTKTRERRFFGYPINEGWETELNGEPKFISDIRTKLNNQVSNEKSFDISSMNKFKGKKFYEIN